MATPVAGPAQPTSARFDVTEYLDRSPLRGVRLSVQASLRTERKLGMIDVPDDRAGRGRAGRMGGDGVGDGAPRPMARVRQPVISPDVEDCGTKTIATGADGRATFTWDPARDVQFATAWTAITGRHHDLVPRMAFRVGFTLRPGATPDLFPLTEDIGNGGTLVRPISLDLAGVIVGHVTETTARLWFAPSKALLEPGVSVSIECAAPSRRVRARPPRQVTFTSGPHVHGVVDLVALRPATEYEAWLVVSDGTSRWEGARCWFRTADPAATGVRLAFASCNRPSSDRDLERWRAMKEWNPDLTLLIGDQVYGDNEDPNLNWTDEYELAYRSQWRHRPIREAMRHGATYMMHDDHDIADDWGTSFTTISRNSPTSDIGDQMAAGRAALDAYQHAHNPPMPHRVSPNDAYDFSLRRGPVAIYVLDERTKRGVETADPVLGDDQWKRLRTWASSAEVASADVIVLVSPVPLALCDVQAAQDAIETWNRLVGTVEALTAPVWAISELLLGHGISDLAIDTEYAQGRMVEPDLADQWTYGSNRQELGRLLELLFDLQNDPLHRRAVVVVSGDAHVSMIHDLVSWNVVRHPNNIIHQVTSSPIGLTPDGGLEQATEIADDIFGPFGLSGFQVTPVPAGYTGAQRDSAARRSFGTVSVRRRTEPGRVYEVRLALQFQPGPAILGGDEIRLDLRYDLDTAGPPTPLQPLNEPFRMRRPS